METILNICSIASGSNGNCYWIENNEEAVLIDIGISYKMLRNRAAKRKIDLSKIKAIFITHEHSDHVRGLQSVKNHLDVEVYMTEGTKNNCKTYYLPGQKINIIKANDVISVGNFKIHSFAKQHDVAEPCSFRVQCNEVSIGIFTDIGTSNNDLIKNLNECNAVFLESNYDEEMLKNGKYPEILKRRVSCDYGHLSNKQAKEIVLAVQSKKLHTIILSHLSAENNTPIVALDEFQDLRNDYTILTASREMPSEIISVSQSVSLFSKKN